LLPTVIFVAAIYLLKHFPNFVFLPGRPGVQPAAPAQRYSAWT
jgi:hypothetical protein